MSILVVSGVTPMSQSSEATIVRAFVSGDIRIRMSQVAPGDMDRLKARLRFANPAYVNAARLGLRAWGIPRELECYNELGPHISIPRGAAKLVKEVIPNVCFVDRRSACERVILPRDIPLRDYQQAAVDAFCKKRQGYVVIPCGGGKTRIALGIIGRLGLKTLVLVHTRDLQSQWQSEAAKFDLPVTVRTIQGLMEAADRFNTVNGCDLLIVDEAHHIAAPTFHSLVHLSSARYRLGLTATPDRADGLNDFLRLYFGGLVYKISHADLVERGVLVVPEIRCVNTGFKYPYKNSGDYAPMIQALVGDVDRNNLILDTVVDSIGPGDVGLVLSNRVEHCRDLARFLRLRGLRAEDVTGKVSKKEREKRLVAARKGEIQVLCATSLADEGLDLPILSRVYLAFPSRAQARTAQRLGRLMRPHPDKGAAILFDFCDPVKVLRSQYAARRRLYTRVLGA